MIIGPGDLYTSIMASLIVKNISEVICKSKADKIYVCNLMTEPGETGTYDALDHVEEILHYLREDCLNYILISNTPVSKEAIQEYHKKNQAPVKVDRVEEIKKLTQAKVILTDLGHEEQLVRHDFDKIRNCILDIIKKDHLNHSKGLPETKMKATWSS